MRRAVASVWLLGRDNLDEDVAEAAAKVRDGFRFFKLKVATKALGQDIATTHALRAALGPRIALCADANCGFSREAARYYVEAMRQSKLLFLEQRLAAAGLAGRGHWRECHRYPSAPTRASMRCTTLAPTRSVARVACRSS